MGIRYGSNVEDLNRSITGALGDFGLDSPSRKAPTVGERIASTFAKNIHERGQRQEGIDGRWRDNAPSVVARKGRNSPNILSGAMLSEEQIAGVVSVGHNETDMVYGKDDESKKNAHYAHTGQSHLKIVRPFFGILPGDADAALTDMAEDFSDHLSKG